MCFQPQFLHSNWNILQSYFTTGGLSPIKFVLAISPLRLATSNFILQLNTCGYSPYVTSSLTRGWICRLQLLLVITSAVMSESGGTHNHILLSHMETPAGTGWPSCSPRHWVPFSSSPTTLTATVEVLEPASTRDSCELFLSRPLLCYDRRSVGQSVLE
jgi:hypothetical protein